MAAINVIPKGTKVRQKVKVHEGVIDNTRFDDATQSLKYHVTGMRDGEPAGIWFDHSEIEAADPKAAANTEGAAK